MRGYARKYQIQLNGRFRVAVEGGDEAGGMLLPAVAEAVVEKNICVTLLI